MKGITFQRERGGLSRRAPGEDHVSALLFYSNEAAKQGALLEFYSLEDAERAGISLADTPILYYHIAEFFRVAPQKRLFVQAVAEEKMDASFKEVRQLQQHAAGAIRQIGVWLGTKTAVNIENLSKVCQDLAAMNMPLSTVVAYRLGKAELAKWTDLGANEYPRVSVCVAQDGGGLGAHLQKKMETNKHSITAIGACLGAIGRAKVHESIAWVEKQDMVSTTYVSRVKCEVPANLAKELDVAALVDGTLMAELTPTEQELINGKRYLFLRKHVGQAGSYWNDSFTADKPTSDYAYLENNRTIDKAMRGVYKALLPQLSGPIQVDASTGCVAVGTITFLETLAEETLQQMERAGELSGFQVSIDPNQSVLSTSSLAVVLKLIPMGVLREINVRIGFTIKIEE